LNGRPYIPGTRGRFGAKDFRAPALPLCPAPLSDRSAPSDLVNFGAPETIHFPRTLPCLRSTYIATRQQIIRIVPTRFAPTRRRTTRSALDRRAPSPRWMARGCFFLLFLCPKEAAYPALRRAGNLSGTPPRSADVAPVVYFFPFPPPAPRTARFGRHEPATGALDPAYNAQHQRTRISPRAIRPRPSPAPR